MYIYAHSAEFNEIEVDERFRLEILVVGANLGFYLVLVNRVL